MNKFLNKLTKRKRYVLIFVVIILVVSIMSGTKDKDSDTRVTTVVETGAVSELVSVSGIAKAEQTAELAFPVTGIVKKVNVKIGDEVKAGDPLVSLDTGVLYADRQDALAILSRAIADRDELLVGPTASARVITDETIRLSEIDLENTKKTEAQKVTNAYRAMLSSDLTAYPTNSDEDSIAPTISGTYTCDKEGVYIMDVFSSGANSGYSYRLSGLEINTQSVTTDHPSPLGKCGLQIQFGEDSNYGNSQWKIEIPNTKSPTHVTYKNAYSLALAQSESAIATAEQAFALAKSEGYNQNAPARNEAVARANASVAQAQANLNRIDLTIADRTLTAPFDGTITKLDILPGETVTTEPLVTLLASSEFEVTARIPEIDIGRLSIGQKVKMLFDARSGEIVNGEISFISLKSTEIDGVAYYEAFIKLNEIPDWIRSGLNADIEISIQEKTDALRLPKRFVTRTDSGYEVLLQKGEETVTTPIVVEMEGNDGFLAITGLNAGDVVVAP